MMKTIKGMMLGMGIAAAAMAVIWKNPKYKQAVEDAAQNVTDKAEDLKDTLGM